MSVLSWARSLFLKTLGIHMPTPVGVMRTFLRGVISIATRLEETLPDIRDTMTELDPGQTYADWANQYRAAVRGSSLEEKLATWPSDMPIDSSVITWQNFRRARKYRYIFTGEVIDDLTKTKQWKMFSIYSNKMLSPNDIKTVANNEWFGRNYEKNVYLNDIILKRVQKWTAKK